VVFAARCPALNAAELEEENAMGHHRLWPAFLMGALWADSVACAATASDVGERTAGHWVKVGNPVSNPTPRVSNVLANTQWRLMEFQSTDGQAARRPEAPSRYVMRLDSDGTATLWLNCHRVTGSWIAQPAGKSSGRDAAGRLEFSHIPSRASPCPMPDMEENLLRQASNVRSFTLKQGRLHLGLADSGIYVWSRDGTTSVTAPSVTPPPAAAAPKNSPQATARPAPTPQAAATAAGGWQVTTRVNLREQPSTQSRVVALLSPGTQLVRGECQTAEGREWCRVTVATSGEGFVAAEYLKPVPATATQPVAPPAPATPGKTSN
jgi:hypothetical protein